MKRRRPSNAGPFSAQQLSARRAVSLAWLGLATRPLTSAPALMGFVPGPAHTESADPEAQESRAGILVLKGG